MTSLCQGLHRSGLAGGSGGEDPGYQVAPPPRLRNEQAVAVENVFKIASLLNNADLELLLNKLFLLALAHDITSNPAKFCSMSMKPLKQNNKSNLLYKFALVCVRLIQLLVNLFFQCIECHLV